MSHHVPQPRYSPEHKEQAKNDKQPLFTVDIDSRHLDGSRTTTTGVLTPEEAADMIGRIQRAVAKSEAPIE